MNLAASRLTRENKNSYSGSEMKPPMRIKVYSTKLGLVTGIIIGRGTLRYWGVSTDCPGIQLGAFVEGSQHLSTSILIFLTLSKLGVPF
jgi:hypothetical protein